MLIEFLLQTSIYQYEFHFNITFYGRSIGGGDGGGRRRTLTTDFTSVGCELSRF